VTCDEARALLIDALVAQRDSTDVALRLHLDACAACRVAQDEYRLMWRQLGDLPAAHPSADARERFERRLVATRLPSLDRSRRRVLSQYVGALAAAALIAALAGYGIGARRSNGYSGPAWMDARGPESTFLILLHMDSTFQHGHLAEYQSWAEGLERSGTLVGSERLGSDSAAWFGPPHATAALGDHLAGFFVIRAKNEAEARRIAETCPHLKYGGRIELRMIDTH
jgi:hypothetical protein